MRALVTNDDGVRSEGLLTLARTATARGLDVTVVAPSFDASGSSAAMTATATEGRVVVDRLSADRRVTVLGVQGPPAFIVRAAMYGAFGPPPDVVLSGVNRGLNTGRAVLHSGTVGAALTAANYGRRGLAVSAELDDDDRWDPDPEVIAAAVGWIVKAPEATVLNVNVPRASRRGGLEVRSTALAELGTVQGSVSETAGGSVPVTFADGGDERRDGTDAAALADGHVSVTAIRAVTEDPAVDVGGLLRTGAPEPGYR